MKQNLHRPNTFFVEIHKMQVKYLYFIVHITGHLKCMPTVFYTRLFGVK